VRDADVRDLLDALASNHHLNIVYGPETRTRISIRLEKVSLEAAVDAIVRAGGLRAFRRDGILYVLPEADDDGPRRDTRVFRLEYADPVQAEALVKGMLGPRGKLATYGFGRTLVVWDEPQRLDQLAEMVRSIDAMPRQVLIEARILEVNLDDETRFGVDWSDVLKQGELTTELSQSGFAAEPGPGRDGFFATLRRADLRALLEALEIRTNVRTLANPKVLGLDNRPAEIIIGAKLGYPVTTSTNSATLQSIQFIEVGTQLDLVPHVVADGSVLLEVHPEVSDGEVVDGLPRETTTEATTTVLVREGETLFIGGLIREKVQKSRRGVPLLSRLPVLGWLFGKTVEVTERGEIVVLLTPQILPPGAPATAP
jgi:type II secretory pathway component GspD/PulD (secretin)